MSEKVNKILEDLKSISLLEASELITKIWWFILFKDINFFFLYSTIFYGIEETFNVQANFNVAAVSNGIPSAGKIEEVVVEEKTEFTVVLKEVPTAKRINVIKVVRTLTSLGLKEAKDLIETVPKPVIENVSKEKAEETKKLLEEAGAIVIIE